MMSEADLPALAQLVSGGFNQDYEDVFGTPREVVSLYAGNPVFSARLPLEVTRLDRAHPGTELDEVLRGLGNGYDYEAAGLTAREWLAEVVEQVRREAPPVDERHAGLVGQTVRGVSAREALTVRLDDICVDFLTGVSCAAPGGTAQLRAGDDPALLEQAVGEEVVCAVETDGQLTLATPRVRVYSLPSPDGPGFVVRPEAT